MGKLIKDLQVLLDHRSPLLADVGGNLGVSVSGKVADEESFVGTEEV